MLSKLYQNYHTQIMLQHSEFFWSQQAEWVGWEIKIPQALGLTFVLVCSEQNAYSVQTAVVGWVGWFHFSTQG